MLVLPYSAAMRKADVIEHFKRVYGAEASQSKIEEHIANLLDIRRQAIIKWGDIIPKGSAYELQALTSGALRVDTALYPRRYAA